MDLQEFKSEMLYFQEPIDPEVEILVNRAAQNYGPASEDLLLKAREIAENDLTVLIGLYRYYYYQNRYLDGVAIAFNVMAVVGNKIGFPESWKEITLADVTRGILHSFCLVRLYFFALKAAGYLQLRLGNYEEGRAMIEKVVAMDSKDRLGAQLLLDVLDNNKADVIAFQPRQEWRHANGTV